MGCLEALFSAKDLQSKNKCHNSAEKARQKSYVRLHHVCLAHGLHIADRLEVVTAFHIVANLSKHDSVHFSVM